MAGQQLGEGGEQGPVRRGVAGSGDLAAQHVQLVTEHRDLNVLVVLLRPEGEQAQDPADEQEYHGRAHTDDLAKPASWLLAGEILYLHPSGDIVSIAVSFLGWRWRTSTVSPSNARRTCCAAGRVQRHISAPRTRRPVTEAAE